MDLSMGGISLPPQALQGHKRGIFADASESPQAKAARIMNPQYQVAFQSFDKNGDGSIDFLELQGCLQNIQASVEGGTPRAMFPHAFSPATELSLFGKFGNPASPGLDFMQFSAMCQYLEGVKAIFVQIDTDHSGTLDISELSRALHLSGFVVSGFAGGEDPASKKITELIGKSYDDDGNGVLSFDEFVRLRIEWDQYIDAWGKNVVPGANYIAPAQTLQVLETIKRSMEPIGLMSANPILAQLQGFDSAAFFGGLFYQSMFANQHTFSIRACEWLIIRFGSGNPYLTFEQFCMMLNFLKEQKVVFSKFDLNKSGKLGMQELANAFASSGMPMPLDVVQQIGLRYDADNSGAIEFDEFLQMQAEWTEVGTAQNLFAGFGEQRASAQDLQNVLKTVRVVYGFVNGAIPTIQPFSIRTCRLLIATFGSPLPGQRFATSVTYNEYLLMMHRLKVVYYLFQRSDLNGNGALSGVELQQAMAAAGNSLPPDVINMMLCSYDVDNSGELEFDEFISLLLEAELFQTRFRQMQVPLPGVDLSALLSLFYSMPRTLGGTLGGMGM